jgi:hypothetical protein
MSGTPIVAGPTACQLEDLGFEQLQTTTWRSTGNDVMVFVSIHANTDDRRVVGHLTKRDPGLGPTVKPYSKSYSAPFKTDVDAAVLSLAQHMLLVAEEHAIAGTVKFQRFSGHSDAEVIGQFD